MRSERIMARLEPELKKDLEKIANANNRSISQMVELIIKDNLYKYGKKTR